MRQFIHHLKEQGQLTIVEDKVSPILEAPRLAQGQGPTFFERVDGAKAIVNLVGSRKILADALHVDEKGLINKLLHTGPTGTTSIQDFNWPRKTRPDLVKLPIMRFFERDGGRYVTAGIIIAKYREHVNASIHRMMVLDSTSLAVRLVPPRHTYLMHRASAKKGESLNVAIAIGVDPVTLFGVSTRVPCGLEFNYVAALKQDVQPLVMCENGVPVPPCEIVLEGHIHPTKTAAEGPFVDLTGTYDVVRPEPVIELTCMKSNRDPIYHSILPASVEHALLMGIPYEPLILKSCQRAAKVKNVILTEGGRHYLHAIIQIEKQTEGDAKNVIMAAFAAHTSLKHAVVIDEDIDIYNKNDVEYAIATRVRGDVDILMVPNVRGSSLDPRAASDGTTTKVGVDATAPLNDRWKFERVR
ncbi:MAG: UbiD family decarboxylase [Euryarchaeota archaeon]|nr:UbiD family decarboxylase [Euryarchaeota archaeon]